jgi:spore coat protein U-like protein
MALADDSSDVDVSAEVAQNCEVVEASGSLALAAFNVPVQGTFKYTCNFVGHPTLTFTSASGVGVVTTENGGASLNYGIYLNDAPLSGGYLLPTNWLQATGTPQSYPSISTSNPANSIEQPYFYVGLTQVPTVAGSYTDTLIIDILP